MPGSYQKGQDLARLSEHGSDTLSLVRSEVQALQVAVLSAYHLEVHDRYNFSTTIVYEPVCLVAKPPMHESDPAESTDGSPKTFTDSSSGVGSKPTMTPRIGAMAFRGSWNCGRHCVSRIIIRAILYRSLVGSTSKIRFWLCNFM